MLVGLRQLPARLCRALILVALMLSAAIVLGSGALAQKLDEPTFVVALERLDRDGLYARTVLLAAPLPNGGHYGFILNKPTKHAMGEIFKDHEPSKAVKDPVYLGGPDRNNVIFAMTRAEASPGTGSRELVPGVWLVVQSDVIDELIEKTPNAARYYMGYVFWKPGELAEEVRKGLMMLRPVDPAKLFLPDPSGLYDELVTPSRKPPLET